MATGTRDLLKDAYDRIGAMLNQVTIDTASNQTVASVLTLSGLGDAAGATVASSTVSAAGGTHDPASEPPLAAVPRLRSAMWTDVSRR